MTEIRRDPIKATSQAFGLAFIVRPAGAAPDRRAHVGAAEARGRAEAGGARRRGKGAGRDGPADGRPAG